MEENASSSDDLVFGQSLNHEQLQNREVLARRLQLRRPREELVNQGIMPAMSAAPSILQQKSRLERAQKSDILQRKIRVRPDRSQLIQRHILEDSNADPSIQATQISLKRKKLQDDLNERLLLRPGPLELVNKNILDPGSFVGHAIKEGAVEYADTKDSSFIFNPLSPIESFNDDSPQLSPSNSSSVGSPPELPPSPVFLASPKITPTDPQFTTFSQNATSQANQPGTHIKLKNVSKSRKKSSKAKFKKYKYHEYRPPNTETSSTKSLSALPADSPYALLLRQQQLYLQLQVLCQNYPQTFLPLLPTVKKSSPADNHPVKKPMKLEEMRVVDLRNELKNRGLPVSGSKNNLMERLKLANAVQGSDNPTAITSVVTTVAQTTPVPVAPKTTLSRSTSAPSSIKLLNQVRPSKILNDAEKILQMEQNISVEEIQKKIQQLQYLNVQLQLQQLDLKKSQQGQPISSNTTAGEIKTQLPALVPNQQSLHHQILPQSPPMSQLQLQPQNNQQCALQTSQQGQHPTVQVQQQQLEQHLQQLIQLQQQQQQQQQQRQQQEKQQQQLKHQQFQKRQQQLLQQQKERQKQQLQSQNAKQHLNQQQQQQQLYNHLSTSPKNLQKGSESNDAQIPLNTVTSLPPPEQCQVSISATPLMHCSALACSSKCSHLQPAVVTNPNINSVQQHNVIHIKQPVKPVIILQPPKQQQRAELLFSPTKQGLEAGLEHDTFFQQLNKNDRSSSLRGDMDMDRDSNWQGLMDSDARSSTSSPTSLDRSPPPYFQAVAGRMSPRSASFSADSMAGEIKPHQRTNTVEGTLPLGHRRSLSVPSVSHSCGQQQELQKGHKSHSTMFLDFPEADEMNHMADNYHGITQEIKKAMIFESQNSSDNGNVELLEILGDSLFPPSTGTGGVLRATSPNMNAFSPFSSGADRCYNSSPKRSRSPSTNLPSYQEALQTSLNVPSTTTGSFTTDELLNGYHEHTSSVISSLPHGKLPSPSIDDSIGSPMRVDHDDMDLLPRSVCDENGFRRNSFENFRTQNMQSNSIYHVNPCDIFGNPTDARWIKQEGSELSFLDTGTAASELVESMDFAMSADSMGGVTFSQ